jgi:hypothetical protein
MAALAVAFVQIGAHTTRVRIMRRRMRDPFNPF